MKLDRQINEILDKRFGCDSLIALATLDDDAPAVRTVDAFYENGCFYIVTHAMSGKMQQITRHSKVAVSGEWFTGRGIGENLGHVLRPENAVMMDKLRTVFAQWYGNGHVDEADQNTVLLRIRLLQGVLFSNGTRFDIDF